MRKPTAASWWKGLLFCAACLSAGCGSAMFLHVRGVEIDQHLRVLLGGGGNSTLLLHGREVFVTDVKFGDYAYKLRDVIEKDLGREVQRVMLTHAHFDHAGGLFAFPQVAVVMVHPNARRRLEAKGVRAPFVEVENEVRLVLGGEEVRVLNVGSGHTDGDLIAFVPARKLLITGDLFSDGFEPNIDESYGGSLLGLKGALENMLQLDFERVVPGHGDLTTRASLEHVAQYLRALQTEMQKARAQGLSEDAAVNAVRVPHEFDDIKTFLGTATRAKNTRLMYRDLTRQAALSPGPAVPETSQD